MVAQQATAKKANLSHKFIFNELKHNISKATINF